MNLEEKATKGNIIYIHSIDYNEFEKELVNRLLRIQQAHNTVVRELTFFKVQNFSEEIDEIDFDKDCLDSVIGILCTPCNSGVEYRIQTEQRSLFCISELEPDIQDLT